MAAPDTVLLAGIGPGFGMALAQVFAKSGFDVIGVARSRAAEGGARACVEGEGRSYAHVCCDLGDARATATALGPLSEQTGHAIVLAQRLLRAPFEDIPAADFEDVLRVNCLGAVHLAQAVLPAMKSRGSGTLIFAGATASLRGGAGFSAFAASKFALRGLAQALAREYGRFGVHVAHLVIDGLIDAPQTDARFPDATGPRIDPFALAETCVALVRQPNSAMTSEIDIRPAEERH